MKKYYALILVVIIVLIIAIGSFAYISANTHVTKIEVISNSTLQNGDNVELELKDDYRNYLSNESVEVKIIDNNGWVTKSTVVTNDMGYASVKLSALENGNYTVHCTYNGTLFLEPSKTVQSLAIDDGY